jgi:hypothetical protein
MAKQRDSKATGKSGRASWFDEKSQTPRIEESARQLESFLKTVADGKVTDKEIKAQEARVVAVMKEVEPLLDDSTHEKVSRLLYELTAYDLMQTLYHMRPPARQFRG